MSSSTATLSEGVTAAVCAPEAGVPIVSAEDGVSHADVVELRLATIGNVDSGKSTIVGVLTRDMLDDGRGKARATVFRHSHEKETGRTSAIGIELMGLDSHGKTVRTDGSNRARHFAAVRTNGRRVITFCDLAGHERYLKTTIAGLTGMAPDYALVLVGLNMGVSKMTREHLGLAAALDVPPIIICTKSDIAPPDVAKATVESVKKILKAARKMPYVVKSEADVCTAADNIGRHLAPIFLVSSVTGQGIDLVRLLVSLLPPRVSLKAARGESLLTTGDIGGSLNKPMGSGAASALTVASCGGPCAESSTIPVEPSSSDRPGRCTVDSVFSVPGVGMVVAGIVLCGPIVSGSTMLLGPTGVGEFISVVVRSIEINYVSFPEAQPGVSAAFAIRPRGKPLSGKRTWVRKGLHLVDPRLAPTAVWSFEAEVLILHHSTTVAVGYAPQCHIGVSSQSATITSITLRGSPAGAGASVDCAAAASADGQAVSLGAAGPAGGSPGKARPSTGGKEAAPEGPAAAAAEATSLLGRDVLRTGNRAIVSFRYIYKPEYIHVGEMLLFREGHCKGVGRVTRVG